MVTGNDLQRKQKLQRKGEVGGTRFNLPQLPGRQLTSANEWEWRMPLIDTWPGSKYNRGSAVSFKTMREERIASCVEAATVLTNAPACVCLFTASQNKNHKGHRSVCSNKVHLLDLWDREKGNTHTHNHHYEHLCVYLANVIPENKV